MVSATGDQYEGDMSRAKDQLTTFKENITEANTAIKKGQSTSKVSNSFT